MKAIGILGGTSWPSTMSPYRLLNEDVARRLGGHHSARITLYSIDYDPIKSLYHHGWDRIPGLLKDELEQLLALKPDGFMIANNTLHKAYDRIDAELAPKVPIFHAARLVREELKKSSKKALFLGTSLTMEDDFYTGPLRSAGIELMIPDPQERADIQSAQSRLAKGEPADAAMAAFFTSLLARYQGQGCASAVLACTELPLAIDNSLTSMALIDPLVLQCRAAVDFALG